MGNFDDRVRTSDYNLHDGYGLPIDSTSGGRLKVDVVLQKTSDTIGSQVNELDDAIHAILGELDGYHPDSTGTEHYNQHSEELQAIRKDLDGYLAQADLSGLDQTVTEHYAQHSDAIQTVINSLDGYSSDTGLSITVYEHYNQHSNAIQTILSDLDGYIPTTEKGVANGVATLDSGGKVPAAQIPGVSLPEVHVVLDDTERLALTVQEGDEVIQTEDGYHYIYDGYDWYIRPVHPHGADHYTGGADEIAAQDLGSDSAPFGKVMETDGYGGWSLVDVPTLSIGALTNITHQLTFIKAGGTSNSWLKLYGEKSSDITPGIIPWNSKLTGITFSNAKDGADVGIKIFVVAEDDGSGPLTTMYTWTLNNCRVARKTNFSTDIVFDAGDKVAIFADDIGDNPEDVTVVLYFVVVGGAIIGEHSEDYSGKFEYSEI